MHSAKSLLPWTSAVILIAAIAGGLLWWHAHRAPLPSQSVATDPHATVEQLEREELRNEEPEPPPPLAGPIELSPDVASTRSAQLDSCRKVTSFVDQCVAKNIPLDATPWSKIHGYSMPLPPIPAPHDGFIIQPNPSVCAVASEWRTYCEANIFERK